MNSNPVILWLVDDSPAEHAIVRKVFGENPPPTAHIESFYSAEEACESLNSGAAPSLVLLDVNMPGIGGVGFLEYRAKHHLMHIPVILYSSSSAPQDVRDGYALGANSCVRKPDTLGEYRGFARSLHDFWLRWAVLPEEWPA